MKRYYDGDIVKRGGYRFRVNYPHDEDHEAPWDDGDGRGIVRELPYGENKKPGERIMQTHNRDKWAFDWAGTIKKAKEEGWGVDPALVTKYGWTNAQMAEAATKAEFDLFRSWLKDEWHYVGIVITHLPEEDSDTLLPGYVPLDYGHAVWGFQNNDEYLTTETDNMIDSYVAELDNAAALVRIAEELAALEKKQRDDETHTAIATLRSAIAWSHFTDEYKLSLRQAVTLLAGRAGVTEP